MEEALIPEVPTKRMPKERIKKPISDLKQGQYGWITPREALVTNDGDIYIFKNALYCERKFEGACIRIQRAHDQMKLEVFTGAVFEPYTDFIDSDDLIGVAEIEIYI